MNEGGAYSPIDAMPWKKMTSEVGNLVATFDNLKSGCKPDKRWDLTTCQPIYKKITMDYKIVQEKKPTWKIFG